jgi:hypothetical protein
MLLPSWLAAMVNLSFLPALPFRLTFGRGFDAMVDRVAHQVHERITDFVGDGLVELRFLAAHFQMDLFVEFLRKVPHHARQLGEHLLDRQHAGLHNGQLQVGGHQS